eukprot:83873_1
MESVPLDLILSISSYLSTDDVAHFSLVSKQLRDYTKQHKVIDLSQILYYYSRKDFISILKILRFHPFKQWIFPESPLLFHHETLTLIHNMMQRSQHIIKSITFKPVLHIYHQANPFRRIDRYETSLTSILFNLSLHHFTMNAMYLNIPNIPNSALKPSERTLISITSSFGKIANFLACTTCFTNLERLTIRHHSINDIQFTPHTVFGMRTSAPFKFSKLTQLVLKKQQIAASLKDMISIVASLPVLIQCRLEHCRFRCKKSQTFSQKMSGCQHQEDYSLYKNCKSNSLQSLYFHTISVSKRSLLRIADCFGQCLKTLTFYQCKVPITVDAWTYVAANCKAIESIVCDKTCLSIRIFRTDRWSPTSWLNCKRDALHTNDHLLRIALNKAFDNRQNINISVPVGTQPNTQTIKSWSHTLVAEECRINTFKRWTTPKQYETCALCDAKVASGFMEDHVDSICDNALIQCNLCGMNGIKRCAMTQHWDKHCTAYEYMCNQCVMIFYNRQAYTAHTLTHKVRDDRCKKEFHFGNVHNKQYREMYCDTKSTELAWKCTRCQRLCTGSKADHECPKGCINWSYDTMYNICKLCSSKVPIGSMSDHVDNICVNGTMRCGLCDGEVVRKQLVQHWRSECTEYIVSDQPLSMMRFGVPSLYSEHVIRYWIRNQIKNKNVPKEIFALISEFHVWKHDFTAHYEKVYNEHYGFRFRQFKKCSICCKQRNDTPYYFSL